MKSASLIVDPNQTYKSLKDLGARRERGTAVRYGNTSASTVPPRAPPQANGVFSATAPGRSSPHGGGLTWATTGVTVGPNIAKVARKAARAGDV